MRRAAVMLAMVLLLPLAAAAADLQGTLTVREAGWRFFSGEQVVRTVVVDKALAGADGQALLRWRLSVGTAVLRSEAVAVLAPAAEGGLPILLPLPRVQRVTGGRLDLTLERAGATLATSGYDFQIFPPRPVAPAGPGAPEALKGKKLVLLDPSGHTAAALDYLKVQYEELSATWTAVTGGADIFVVGDGVPADELARFLASVQPTVADGAVCIVLEQTGLDAGKFPWLSLAPAQMPCDAVEGPAGTDVLRGELAPDALAGWRGTGYSVERPFRTPVRGNFTLLLDATAGAQAPPETAALEVPCGKGRYIFSQLLIAHGFLDEPVARYALVNLLRYAATVPPHPAPVRAAVLADPQEEAFAKGFAPLGLKADVNPPSLEGYGAVIVYCSEASVQAFGRQKADRIQALRTMVEIGGKLVLLDLRPETMDAFRGLWDADGDLKLEEPGRIDAAGFGQLEDKPLLRGVRPAELEALCRRADFPVIAFTARRAPAPTAAAGVMTVSQGKGAVVFCQLPLPKDDKDEDALRTYSQLLTNMNLILVDPTRRDAQ